MEEHVEKYEKLIRKFTTWGEDIEDIRGAIVVGSRVLVSCCMEQQEIITRGALDSKIMCRWVYEI